MSSWAASIRSPSSRCPPKHRRCPLDEELSMPPASALLRLLAFAVPSALAAAGVQPLLGAAIGVVQRGWAFGLTAPAVIAAGLVFGAGRLFDRGDSVQPPWY